MLALYVDEDSMRRGLVRALRGQGFDVLTTREAAMSGASDVEQLDAATRDRRILVTANIRDFARLHGERIQRGSHHSGLVLLTRRMSIGDDVRAFADLASALGQEEMVDRLEFLANWLRPRS